MAITEAFSVTETVTTTEHSFTTDTAGPDVDTSDGIFQGFFDCSALVAADEFEFAVYEKAQSAGTQRKIWTQRVKGVQSTPIFVTPALVLMHGWDMTWKKIAGTDRSIEGSIRKIA